MARFGSKWLWGMLAVTMVLASMFIIAEPRSKERIELYTEKYEEHDHHYSTPLLSEVKEFFWQPSRVGKYVHVWPPMKWGWKICVGSIIGFLGAAFGSVGGVGGGGIYVPDLTLIIGFDSKSATAISKCMITGAAASTVYYNLKLRHPQMEMPLIDYDLALLFQPPLVLGISIGVACNVIFPDWLITVLLIILFFGTSTKAFLKGVETWKKETVLKKEEARKRLEAEQERADEGEYKALLDGPSDENEIGNENENENGNGNGNGNVNGNGNGNGNGNAPPPPEPKRLVVPILENIYWKELGLLFFVWIVILGLELGKNYTVTCSPLYWVLNVLQFPTALGVSGYEAFCLYTGRRRIQSKGDDGTVFRVHQLILYILCGVIAGVIGGLLGLGGGFILGPLFLELGVHPQVSSATATFAMTFSASMSVVEYYLLKRFPVPYAAYLVAVATVAAFVGQVVVRRVILWLGRASIIIFILAFTIFISAIALGGFGIERMVKRIERHEYMGFDDLCTYQD
ncbi:hypothetical protein ACFE04_008576 [Oxalis oulophora]